MSLIADLKALFVAAKVAKTIEAAPPLESSVLDAHFPESVRTPFDSPIIPVSEIASTIKVVPVVSRGGEPVPISGSTLDRTYIEPLPIYVEDQLGAVEVNNLKLMGMGQKEAWAQRKTLRVRQTIKKTLEALSAQARYNGKIEFPLLLSGGNYATYTVTFLDDITTVNVAATSKWNHTDASLVKVYELLEQMSTTLNKAGFPGQKTHEAGSTAFATLLMLCDATDKPKIPIRIGAGEIEVGGHVVKKQDEVYVNPETGAEVSKIPAGEIRTISAGYTQLFYASLDDLKANNQALPLFMDVVEESRPSRLVITGQSKPLPVVAPKSCARAIVIAE
jgi:hypothetical protein